MDQEKIKLDQSHKQVKLFKSEVITENDSYIADSQNIDTCDSDLNDLAITLTKDKRSCSSNRCGTS